MKGKMIIFKYLFLYWNTKYFSELLVSRTNSACDARVEFCSTTACFYLGGKKREGETTKGAVDEMDINEYVYLPELWQN